MREVPLYQLRCCWLLASRLSFRFPLFSFRSFRFFELPTKADTGICSVERPCFLSDHIRPPSRWCSWEAGIWREGERERLGSCVSRTAIAIKGQQRCGGAIGGWGVPVPAAACREICPLRDGRDRLGKDTRGRAGDGSVGFRPECNITNSKARALRTLTLPGYLAHKKPPHRVTLQ